MAFGALAAAAEGDSRFVSVNHIDELIAVTSGFPSPGEPVDDHALFVDNILPGHLRVGQLAFGVPPFMSTSCNVNPIANDVVCPGAMFGIDEVIIRLEDGEDVVRIRQNRDQSPCPVTVPSYRIEVELLDGDDTVETSIANAVRQCVNGPGGTFGYRMEVEAGGGEDLVDVAFATLGALVTGGSGDDILRGSATADTLSGEGAQDTIAGAQRRRHALGRVRHRRALRRRAATTGSTAGRRPTSTTAARARTPSPTRRTPAPSSPRSGTPRPATARSARTSRSSAPSRT